MKILHVFYGRDIAGGASYSMASLVEGLADRGVEVHVLLPRTKRRVMARRLDAAGVICHELTVPWQVFDANESTTLTRLKNWAKALWSLAATPVAEFAVLRLVRKHQIDLIHIGGAVVGTGAVVARIRQIPLIWHVREFVEEGHGLRYFPWFDFYKKTPRATAVLCVSESLANKMRQYLDGDRIHVVPNGLDRAPSRRMSGDGQPLRLMFAAGLNRSKGAFLLLQALSQLPPDCDVALDIYGRANADQLAEFSKEQRRLGLANRVFYRGYVDTMGELYARHDALVVASTREGFGRATAEAMLSECLVIGSDAGGTQELLGSGRGVLFPPGDIDALRDALTSVCRNYSHFNMVRAQALEFATAELSVDRYVDRVLDVYTEALRGHGAST